MDEVQKSMGPFVHDETSHLQPARKALIERLQALQAEGVALERANEQDRQEAARLSALRQ